MPNVQPINPISDLRIEHKFANLNGNNYHYLLGVPKGGEFKATVFLIHGWPDLSIGWRYQIPALIELGLRVVVPDMMGYGQTDSPKVTEETMYLYGFKQASDDIAELARQLDAPQIILGGHDWGGMVVWRAAAFYPKLISHLFAVCTPYVPPSKTYYSTEELVNGPVPQFGYQLHLASGEVEKQLYSKEHMSAFLRGMYGARTPEGEVLFSPTKGILFDKVMRVGKTRLLSDEELDFYAGQYARNGLTGPLNWYRTRKANWESEQAILNQGIEMPTLFIGATRDSVLKPEMAAGMPAMIPQLTMREVDATHWALMEKPDEVNALLKEWIGRFVFASGNKL